MKTEHLARFWVEINLNRIRKNFRIYCGAYSVTEGNALFLSRKIPGVYLCSEADGLEKMRGFIETADINRK